MCDTYKCGNTYKCDSKDFRDFKILLKVFLHICEYCVRKTYKCAVTRNPQKISKEALDSDSSKNLLESNFSLF